MKHVHYISNRSVRNASEFDNAYILTMDEGDMLEMIGDDFGEPTGAFVKIADGEYSEVWVTFSVHPYANSAVYHRYVSYYRSDVKREYVIGTEAGNIGAYKRISTAVAVYFGAVDDAIAAGHTMQGAYPTHSYVRNGLRKGVVGTSYTDGYYVQGYSRIVTSTIG